MISLVMLSALPPFIDNNLDWWLAGAIVVLGLVIYGFGDLIRFSLRRAWAISSVSFAESIRRRVLWITPLAILGVIVVSQLQRPLDEQDAIRQTTKFALFATGLLVTITAIILACTNLPKEIDTRVIYTIVTKPTTRLEIVVGKVIGFAKVSLTILLIMGLFTLGYLELRAWSMEHDIKQRLQSGSVDAAMAPTYKYWANEGLLTARTVEHPDDLEVIAHEPKLDEPVRYIYGNGEGEILAPFKLSARDLTPVGFGEVNPTEAGIVIQLHIGFARSKYGEYQLPAAQQQAQSKLPITVAAPGTQSAKPTTLPEGATPPNAAVAVQILDPNQNTLIESRQINKGEPIELTDPTGRTPVLVFIPPEVAQNLLRVASFYVNVVGLTNGVEYRIAARPDPNPHNNAVCVLVPGNPPQQNTKVFPPTDDGATPVGPTFRARMGVYGQQLRGGKPEKSPVAMFVFRDATPGATQGAVGFELRTGIESNTEEESEGEGAEATQLQVTVLNHQTGQRSDPVNLYPENNRTAYFNIPVAALAGGNFDVEVRNLSEGDYVGVAKSTLAMIKSQESFATNLLKSLAIMWMLSILVVVIAIFSSTFLSWPIAIVLTLVILLGHWGVLQLGDATAPGIGNMVATDLGFRDPSKAKVVSASVEALSKLLNNLAKILPDIGQFSAIEDIERGVTISGQTLSAPLLVLVTFGLPMLVLSYVFLRNKEVAP